jgi:DNA-binding transcriptional ArsR family regulator
MRSGPAPVQQSCELFSNGTGRFSITFAALADPTRRAILSRLSEGEATVNELAAPHAMSLPSVSRHLKVLERAGLVVKGRWAQWRPCRLDVAPLAEADGWMAPYREFFFEARLARLEQQLANERMKEES